MPISQEQMRLVEAAISKSHIALDQLQSNLKNGNYREAAMRILDVAAAFARIVEYIKVGETP